MDEDEAVPEPGKARPLVILDEYFVYFADANADSPVSPEYLLRETERILAAQRVDVAVELRNTCWHMEPAHTRIRLIARLKEHRFKDFGIIAGVDYMGNWADLHLAVARELPVIPLPPEPPAPPEPQQQLPIVGLVLAAVGALGLFGGLLVAASGSIGLGVLAIFGGLLFLGLGAATWLSQQAAAKLRLAAARDEWERERERRRVEYTEQIRKDHLRSIAKYLIRNYPMDDMKLFCTAMVRVIAHVIRDIEKRGVKVTRESTTRGTFFGASAPSRTDAGDLGV